MKFKRRFIQELESWLVAAHRKPLIVKGARQVGKTHALRTFAERNFRETFYVNFESNVKARELFEKDLDPKRIVRDLCFLLDKQIDIKKDLVIFDEVQLAPNGITSLKYFNEDLSELAICAAGSLIGLNLGADSFPVGNVDILTVYPFTFFEFLDAVGASLLLDYLAALRAGEAPSTIPHQKIFEYLKQYFVCGGMPAIVACFVEHKEDLFRATKLVREQQLTLIETYLNDFAKHCGKTNALHIERVFRAVPAQMTSQIDSKAQRFQFKEVVPGIAQYAPLASAFGWLVNAGLVLNVPILQKPIPPLKSRIKEGHFKLYMHDVGLLGALADIKVEGILSYDFSNFKGYFAENFVAQELLANKAGSIFCWKEGTSEIEFLLDRGAYALPIEVKSGNFKQAKSLRTYVERYNPNEAFLLTGSTGENYQLKSVKTLPMYLASQVAAH